MTNKKSKLITINPGDPVAGFGFIGDPHIWSGKPGRRRDSNYLDTIIKKLEFCAKYCNDHNLWAVILGDLLHDSTDNDLVMLYRLEMALSLFNRKPVVLTGNHDLTQTELTEGTTLHFLFSTGKIHCIVKSEAFAIFEMTEGQLNKKVLLGGTPYGMDIPAHLGQNLNLANWSKMDGNDVQESIGVDNAVWITHDDLAFNKPYPGSKPLHDIIGIDLSVNGHMHGWQQPIMVGSTSWHNPGNINRMTVDLKNHKPRMWVWDAFNFKYCDGRNGLKVIDLEAVDIPHKSGDETFSMAGRITENEGLVNDEKTLSSDSKFVLISKSSGGGNAKTDDAVIIKEAISAEADSGGDSEETIKVVVNLLNQCLIKKN